MTDPQGRTAKNKGRHYDFITSRIPAPLKEVSSQRIKALSAARTGRGHWISAASPSSHSLLKAASLKLWASQNKVDLMLDELQDIYTFAVPLLSAALKEQYGIDDNTRTTYLHLYLPKARPWYAINLSGGVVVRNVSLLDAALHNFARHETCEAASDFITQPDERGLFDIKPIKRKMSIAQFQTLCRELDIGARYTKHLESTLLPDDALAKTYLKHKVVDNQKAAFIAATHLAVMTGDIVADTRDLVLAMLDGQRNLTLKGKIVQFAEMALMDTPLTGIVLISPDLEQASDVSRIIAYVPHDPEHPLKEYASVTDFMNELTRQLRDNAFIESSQMTYRQYFSQFVDQPQRGHFFAGLQARLFETQIHKKGPFDQRPTWREEPISTPNLRIDVTPVTGDFWPRLYQRKLNKILNDARHIAVSTADADSNARWAWWDNFKKVVSDIFNVALMIVTPFVPGLGELMMVYTAYQLTSEVLTSIVDLAEGQFTEAAEHIVGVVTDVIQLAAFAAGAQIGQLVRLKLSPLVEGMKPVQLPDGRQYLWHPDLTPYEQPNLKLPADSIPDEQGLHALDGQRILALENKHYAVQQDPRTGTWRVKHPSRTDAYQPALKHNGVGAWSHEAENPREWEGSTLMRRLGHSVADLSDAQLEQIRSISGTQDNALRRMHVDNAPPPPLLSDSLQRFRIGRDVAHAIAKIRTGQPLSATSYWFEALPTYLEGWPVDKALKVYQDADLSGSFRQYGNPDAGPGQTLSTSVAHVLSGKFAHSLLAFLDEAELNNLFGHPLPAAERLQTLRNLLADEARKLEVEIFNLQYQASQTVDNPRLRLLTRHFPDLPVSAADKLLAGASRIDVQRMDTERSLPLTLKSEAREAAFEARASHAYAGLFDDAQLTADTERLVLNALRIHADTFGDLRIDIRDGTSDGPLRCRVGSDEAKTVRLLIRDEFARYAVSGGSSPVPFENFYDAVLRALPAQARARLGYRTGQGRMFKQWVKAKTEAPGERRTALLEPPILPSAAPQTQLLLRGPALSRAGTTPMERVQDLYPHFSERETTRFVRSLGPIDEALATLDRLERDLDNLRVLLNQWRYQQPEGWGPGANSFRDKGGLHISERLIKCFERKSTVFGERSTTLDAGYALDLSTEFSQYNLELWWKKRPDLKYYLDQVSSLNLDHTGFSASADGLLRDFPRVSQLSARGCRLTRLPDGVGKMHLLRSLRLTDNQIRLTPTAVEQLSNLTRLETLRLDDNPQLGLLPDVGRMPKLGILSLSHTGVKAWPEGLFNKKRPRGFFLDLRDNPLAQIPDVVPGSDDALLVARTRLNVRDLSEANRIAYHDYRRSVGRNPYQTYSPAAERAIDQWPMSDDSRWWNKTGGLGTFREEAWHALMGEPNAEGFFEIIQRQTLSGDYRAGGEMRQQLSNRVWRMIEAMDLDSELRQELFEIATAPTTCADAGAQVFNNMGIKVLASEANALSTSTTMLENRLVTLAKGAARLEHVDDVARADFRSRAGTPDEVEVFLAYETGLAQRLGLPWQSRTMLYRPTAGVDDAMLEQAFDTVISLEQGDGLVNAMIEQPFWDKYLRATYSDAYSRNTRFYATKSDLLEQLRTAQRNWARSIGHPDAQRRVLRKTVLDLAQQIPVAQSELLNEGVMPDATYDRLLNDIGYREKELSRRLTREALNKAGL
ncbi:hypothetical protein LOY55_24610 [Pseudomonas sp. B21-040]|uniref:NEL-type E3 ubiquitin ligase domain-containing protein n=1 Tax=Pseudomonas sp. B21-040 TaxID=2895486 RepID=UPI0021601A8E|nr:NEL-type E3 ubiquitin ligase domain-containing protein [Pseudomonas sp. B21-040]UVL39384.1 hypothetical protein LOY55_24610 [Pseudomonas sp. B21-040]